MKEILPLIIICSVGISVCIGLLVGFFVKFIAQKRSDKVKEEFDLEENTLTVKLTKKDLHK